MKKRLVLVLFGLSILMLPGCLGLQIGGGHKETVTTATIGQQLIDLQAAKDAGALTDAEFEAQKAKLIGSR